MLLDKRSCEGECHCYSEELNLGMPPYGIAVPIIFWYLIIRVWMQSGRKIPFIFIGLWILAVVGMSYLHLPALASRLTQIALAIGLVLIDRYQTGYRVGL